MTRDQRKIDLPGLPFLELQTKMALRMRGARKDHDARCIQIQSVHQQDFGKDGSQARNHAIGHMRALAWHG